MAKGLPDVTQKVGMDADKYFTEGDKVIDKNVELGDSSDDLAEKFERNQMMVDAFAIQLGRLKDKLESNKQTIRDFSGQLGEMQSRLISAQAAQERFNSTEATLDRLSAAQERFTDQQEKATAATREYYQVLDNFQRADLPSVALAKQAAAAKALADQITETGVAYETSINRQASAMDVIVARQQAVQRTIAAANAEIEKQAYLIERTGGGVPGTSAAMILAARTGGNVAAARTAAQAGDTTGFMAAALAAGGAGAAAGGGFGGFGAIGAGRAAAAGGAFPAGTAGYDAAMISGWARQVAPAVHYISMALLELAATAVPAAIALGGAGAVGYQGAEQLIGRGKAIYQVGEALGPAYNTTAATMIAGGKGLGLVQQYQNMGEGGVYDLAGAGISLSSGAGAKAFLGTGMQTLAMLDRATASFQNNFAGAGGTGQKLTNALSGGTAFAKQFGDIAANMGDFLLNMAPALPGVGQMWLGGLSTASQGLRDVSSISRFPLGSLALGGGMAAEAGWRLGRPAIGLLGKGVTGLGGLAAKMGLGSVGEAGLTSADLADITTLLGGEAGSMAGLEGLGAVGGEGLAGALGSLGLGAAAVTGPVAAGLGASAYLTRALVSSMSSPTARQIAGLQGSIYGQGFTSQFTPLAKAIQEATGLGVGPTTAAGQGAAIEATATGNEIGRFGYQAAAGIAGGTSAQNWAAAVPGFSQTMGNLLKSGPQLVSILKSAGMTGVTMAQGMQVAQNALLNLGTAFTSTGQLTAVAKTQVGDYVKALGPMTGKMTGTVPELMQAVGASQIMSSSAMTDLASTNSALDSMTQIMTGGPLGAAALQGAVGAMGPAGGKGGAANALKGFFGPGQAAAWTAFTGTSSAPGVISTMQQNMDQLRSYMTLGAMTPGGASGLAAMYGQSALPYAKESPAALAMLQQQMAMVPGVSVGQSFKQTADAIKASADNVKTANQTMTTAVQKTANIPQTAQAFGQTLSSSISTALATQAGTDVVGVLGGGKGEAPALKNFVNLLKGQGITSAAGAQAAIDQALPAGERASVNQQIAALMPAAAAAATAAARKASALPAGTSPAAAAEAANALKAGAAFPNGPPMVGQAPYTGVTAAGEAAWALHAGTELGNKIATATAASAAKNWAAITPPAAAKAVDVGRLHAPGQAGALTIPVTYKPIVEHFTPPKIGDQTYKVTGQPVIPHIPKPPDQSFNITGHMHAPGEPSYPNQSFTVTGHLVMVGGGAGVPATGSMVGSGGHLLLGQHGFRVPGMGSGDIVHAMLEPGELVVPRHMVTSGMVDHLKGKIPGFQGGGVIDVPTYAGGAGIRSALEDVATQLMSFMAQSFAGLSGSLRSGGGYGLPYSSALTGGPPPNSSSPPVPVHIASVAPPAVAALGGSGQFPGAAGPMPKAAMKVIDAFEESFKNMPGPWNKLASQILTGLLAGVKNSTHETAAMATTLVNKVKTEIAYGQGVANTAVAGLNFGGMQVATPTMTAQGKPYQYYIDQQNIAAGGQPGSVQEQMGSYLQAMQSFQGDMGKLAKGGLQKRLLSQLYAAGPVQGDAEAQSILGGAGGIKAANQLYNQINSLATKLGVQAMGEQYGTPGKLTGKTVHAGATVSGTGAVHALQSAIDALHGKTVTVTVNIASGGGTASGIPKLNKTQLKQVTQQVRTEILQQAKRNRSSALTLSGYGS